MKSKPLPPEQINGARKLLSALCREWNERPERQSSWLALDAGGGVHTLLERRAHPRRSDRFASRKVVTFTYRPKLGVWTLDFWKDNLSQERYGPMPTSPEIEPLVNEVMADPTGVFWGRSSEPKVGPEPPDAPAG